MLNKLRQSNIFPYQKGGICMKGSVYFRKDRGVWFVQWYDSVRKKRYKIYRYKGDLIYSEQIAQKLLACMQGDHENNTFRIERYTANAWTDVISYLWKWLEIVRPNLSPATYKDYKNSIKNHIMPFFEKHPIQLHEIQYDILMKLLNSINRCGKGKANVMYCLHRCLNFAFRSRRIPELPPFPERADYHIITPLIQWLPEERQIAIIKAIPKLHQPIFLWLKYHLRRPCEAMALHKEDYDPVNDIFIIRRSISARKLRNRTKTGVEHIIPCHSEFRSVMAKMRENNIQILSPFLFICPTSRQKGKRYTQTIMTRLWKNACDSVGESISMYPGLKHSSCSQYINQKGLSVSELQSITDHARLESVKRYAKMEVARKRELMERKIIPLNEKSGAVSG